jgi:hypothetical protein
METCGKCRCTRPSRSITSARIFGKIYIRIFSGMPAYGGGGDTYRKPRPQIVNVSIFEKKKKTTGKKLKRSSLGSAPESRSSAFVGRPPTPRTLRKEFVGKGYDFLQRHIAELFHFQREAGLETDAHSSTYPCPCGSKAEIVSAPSGEVCTICGFVISLSNASEYAHLIGSSEGNNPDNGDARAGAATNTSGLPSHYFLRNAMLGTNASFLNCNGESVTLSLPESEEEKRKKFLAISLRDNVALLKLSQRVFDCSLSILENLEAQRFFAQVKLPCREEEKILPFNLSILYMSCKMVGASRSLRELCNISSDVQPRQVNQWLKLVKHSCTMKIPISKPMEFVARFCQMTKVVEFEERLAREILMKIDLIQLDTKGRQSQEIALAAIYMSTCTRDDPPSITTMAHAVGVSVGAAERTYMILWEQRAHIVPLFMKTMLDTKSNGLDSLPTFA